MAFKMRSGNGPLKFKTMGSSPIKTTGVEEFPEGELSPKERGKAIKRHDTAYPKGHTEHEGQPQDEPTPPTKMKSPMKDRYEGIRHLGNPEGGAMWHEDDTPHSDRTITPEEEAEIKKRREEERAAEIAENQKKLDASRVVIPEGIGGLGGQLVPSAGSYESFLDYESKVDKWIEEGMDPKEAIAKAQKMMNEALAAEKGEKK